MPTAAIPTPAESLARLIAGLRRAIAAAAVRSPLAAVLVLLWPRLLRLSARFDRLAARIAAGERPGPAPRRAPAAVRTRQPYQRLPRGFGWLLAVPEARAAGTQLSHLLAQPEMAGILADPRSGRVLRPLCRMLGVALPPALMPPARPAPQPGAGPATPASPAAMCPDVPSGLPDPASVPLGLPPKPA